jgi:hypothetical protein
MKPTLGRIVLYKLDENDEAHINRRRTTGAAIAERINNNHIGNPHLETWPIGAQAHIGNEVKAGDVFPMMITRVWWESDSDAVNGQVFLDGNDVLWATSVSEGEGGHAWAWPPRV